LKKKVCGVDEVGRGALAGPLVVASVIFKSYDNIPCNIKDSKQVNFEKRKKLFKSILKRSHVGISCIDAKTIDKEGITKSTEIAIKSSIDNNKYQKDIILIDGNYNINTNYETLNIVKGDSNYVSIAAASIVAKVIRDYIMILEANQFPQYLWHKNKGYGTKDHLRAIQIYGITDFHRKSFKISLINLKL